MRMLEYEGKALLLQQGIAIPPEIPVENIEDAAKAATQLGYPVVVKAQVLAGGRGKAGGIKLVRNESELREAVSAILGMNIKGEVCQILLIASAVDIATELYAGITLDPAEGKAVLIFSTEGGIDIEEVAKTQPQKVRKYYLSSLELPRRHIILDELRKGGLVGKAMPKVCDVVMRLIQAFYERDCTTLEINPLVLTPKGDCLALDAKAVIDDAALKRQKMVQTDNLPTNELEMRAANIGVNYVALDGTIAVIAGGAGLGMATVDMVAYCGGKPASFLDTGGGISTDNMAEALRISLATDGVKGVVINIFGGINNCAVVAKGISLVLDEDNTQAKLSVKMRGNSQDEGWALLEERNIPIVKYGTTEEAVQNLIDALKES